jgi:hypothetical protein
MRAESILLLAGIVALPLFATDSLAQLRTVSTGIGRHAPYDVLAFKRPVDIRDASLIPGAVERAGLTVAAEHYDREGEDTQFSVDLKESRIVAIQVTISNLSSVKVLVDGRVRAGNLAPLSGEELLKRTERSTKGSGMFLNILSLGRGTTALRLDTDAANEAVAGNYQQKSLRDKVLQPGETTSGFVFFDTEALARTVTCLSVSVHSLDRWAYLALVAPIHGLNRTGCSDVTAAGPDGRPPKTTDATSAVKESHRDSPAPPVSKHHQPVSSIAKPATPPAESPRPPVPVAVSRPDAAAPPIVVPHQGETVVAVRKGMKHYDYTNGDRYEGEFYANQPHGRGTYFFASGDRYEGEFQYGKQNGHGTYFFSSGDRYEGQFIADSQSGQGSYHYANGDKYQGEFQSGKQHGRGTYYYASGDRYEGLFVDGTRHGSGVYHFRNGTKRPMNFIKGTEGKP